MRSIPRPAGYKDIWPAIVLLAPFALVLCLFTLYPLTRALLYSFQDFTALNPDAATWVGLSNYAEVVGDDSFRTAVLNTLTLLGVTVPVQTALALLIANALNQRIRFGSVFRALYFLPYITAPVAVGAIMLYLFGPDGALSGFLSELLGTVDGAWYAVAPEAFILVCLVVIWTNTGFFSVIFLAGLQSIPAEVYEAAALDGAGWWVRLRKITIPLLRSTMILVVVMGSVVAIQVFEQPYVLSTTGGALPGSPGGSTSTLVMYVYTEAFRYFKMGQASAAAFVVVGLVLVFSVAQTVVQRRLAGVSK